MLSISPLSPLDFAPPPALTSSWFERLDETEVPTSGTLDEWIVQLDAQTIAETSSVAAAATLFEPYGITVLAGLGTAGWLQVRVDGESMENQETILAGLPFLDSWQPNYVVVTDGAADVVNDPSVSVQWGLDQINIGAAWTESMGTGVVVAVLDSGITLNHPDLQTNIWANPGETLNGLDSDSNGFIDDLNGWNFAGGNNNVTDSDGHGTHVAGIIGAVADNGIGGSGVAPGVTLLPIKVLDGKSGSTASIVAGINYAVMLKTQYDVNIRVINASLGGYGLDPAVGTAITAAGAAGIVVVASAGNDGSNNDTKAHYPSGYNTQSNVISVASTNQYDSLHTTSNYGVKSVDLAAPGVQIYSTTLGVGYAYMTGTSMAAPMVSGAVAILAAIHPDWTPAELKTAILAAVDPLPNLTGKVASGGRLNIGDAVAPSGEKPLNLLAAGAVTNNTVALQWTAVAGATAYTVERSTDGIKWSNVAKLAATKTECIAKSLKATTTYYFRVIATGSFGTSAVGGTIAVSTRLALPAAPALKTVSGDSISVTWKKVAGAMGYQIQRSLTGSDIWEDVHTHGTTTPLSFVDTGLATNTEYSYRVIALGSSAVTDSVPSTAKSTKTAPTSPTDLTVGNLEHNSLTLSWTSVDGATKYRIERLDTNGRWRSVGTTTKTEHVVKSLKPATAYAFRVVAIGKTGSSTPSLQTDAVTLIAPPPTPKGVKVFAQDSNALRISWTAVASADSYLIERYDSVTKTWSHVTQTTATSYLDSDLALANTQYGYRISAINTTGASKFSSKANGRTLRAAMTAEFPTDLTVISTTAKSAMISLAPLQTGNVAYLVEWGTEENVWTAQKKISSKTGLLNLTGLKVGTYYVRLRVETTALVSEWSEVLSFTL